MMLRSRPLCERFNARMLLQIHDELLFEVPGSSRQVMRFVRAMSRILEAPPTPDFRVPIVVEPKIGPRFGDLRELERWEYASNWFVRMWHRIVRSCRRLIQTAKTRLS